MLGDFCKVFLTEKAEWKRQKLLAGENFSLEIEEKKV
jgi:hypothetical protein